MRTPFFAGTIAAALLLGAIGLRAQKASACLPADGVAENLLGYAQDLVTDPGLDAKRQRYGLPVVPASQVEIVQDAQTCARAARAFEHATGDHGKLDRQVHVIRVGTAYIVLDPNEKAGEFQVHIVFDQHWKRLASFAS